MTHHFEFDILIIGSGIAGLSLALRLAPIAKIALISKGELFNSASQYAQGGVAAVTDSKDFSSHIKDTLAAGAGLCDEETVNLTVSQAPDAINWLIAHGVAFTRDPHNQNNYHLTREGGHSQRRIYHVADSTGAAIINTLAKQVQQQPNIHCLTDHIAIDLLVADNQCFGAQIYSKQYQQTKLLYARKTILATGGASAVYLHTSNPKSSSGDGLAMAWRAGCRVANLEFNQFHPTSLYHAQANSFLISEAVRGEGGLLRLPNGTRFMPSYDERAELAPRDIVARAITLELQKHTIDYVLLDITHKPAQQILHLFPMIAQRCLQFNVDITQASIPVVPAAHYTCGGVMTDTYAHTDVEHLYAIGEVAHTGLHGANRMASNSLLECLVFAANAAVAIRKELHHNVATIPKFKPVTIRASAMPLLQIEHAAVKLRQIMSDNVGIIRSTKLLAQAKQQVQDLADYLDLSQIPMHMEALALRNRLEVAQLMIAAARLRKESRGCHYNLDYPQQLTSAQSTILQPQTTI